MLYDEAEVGSIASSDDEALDAQCVGAPVAYKRAVDVLRMVPKIMADTSCP